jgi:hypothetical protein
VAAEEDAQDPRERTGAAAREERGKGRFGSGTAVEKKARNPECASA